MTTNLPNGLVLGVAADEADEAVRFDQLTGTTVPQQMTPLVQAATAGNQTTVATSLANVTIPANTFSSSITGLALRVQVAGHYASNTNNKLVRVFINSVEVFVVTSATNNADFNLDILFTVTFSGPNKACVAINTVSGVESVVTVSAPAVTIVPTSAINVNVQGTATATNDITIGPVLVSANPYKVY